MGFASLNPSYELQPHIAPKQLPILIDLQRTPGYGAEIGEGAPAVAPVRPEGSWSEHVFLLSSEAGQADVISAPVIRASIPYPEGVSRRRIAWRHAIAVSGYHILGLLVFLPWFFSWQGVAFAIVAIYVYGCLGINLCYHRLLSHRSFCCPLWLEHLFATIAVCCLQDTPARWVAVHRKHHHQADEQPDPHSPLANLFWAYVGWLFIDNSELCRPILYDRYARDIVRDRFYRFLERAYVWVLLAAWVAHFAVGFFAALLWGADLSAALQLGAKVWLCGIVIPTIGIWHVTWSGNSFPHLWGYRNYETGDNSRNNVLVALLTNGEGWHNNHHADPASASNQHRWWEFDGTFQFLRVLAMLGLAWNVGLPSRRAVPAKKSAGAS
jgi:stearoyl-CoA desaturase (delta-9 desaturase)